MAYIYQDGKIDGQDVRYWHKQYIERRDAGDELAAENAELKRENAALRALFKPGDADLLLTAEEHDEQT